MPTIRHHAEINCLVSVRGHPFDRTAFDQMFQAMEGISATMVDQPAAARLMNPDGIRGFDVLILYDMPGLDFDGSPAPAVLDPPDELRAGLRALLDQGTGVVALHHALAGWPSWDEYHEWLGGRFLYRPGWVRDAVAPDSGYRHDVTYRADVVANHPVTEGLPTTFDITDELYLCQFFEDDVQPLLRSSATFTREHFYSAAHAVNGRLFSNDGWHHPAGSNLVGWAKEARNARLVYLQPGDGVSAYDNPNYRKLVENAIRWVA